MARGKSILFRFHVPQIALLIALVIIGCGGGGGGSNGSGGGSNGGSNGGNGGSGGNSGPGYIVFISDKGGFDQIYKMPIAGGAATAIDTGLQDPVTVAMNQVGDKLVFASITYTVELYQMGIDGSGSSLVSDSSYDAMWPCFSPDGTQILFTADESGTPQLYTMPVGGGTPTQLTSLANGATMGRFSPSGAKIVFVSGSTSDDVYIMNSNGSGVTKLTSGAEDENQPCFSPDGTKIVYVKDMGDVNGVNGQLWEMNSNGTGGFQLTTTLQDDEEPVFAPDGTAVLFSRAVGSGRELYKVASAGGTETALTTDGANASSPATGW